MRRVRIEGVPFLLLDRPERRNPLDGETRRALEEGLADEVATGARVVGLGASAHEPPVFAAGADLRTIARLTPTSAGPFAVEGQRFHRFVEDLPLRVVAVVDGPCFGGALDLALACDSVLATRRARFAHPGSRLGIVTGWGGTRRLPERVGPALAARTFHCAAVLDAEAARAAGLVEALVDERDALRAAARRLQASAPPRPVPLSVRRAARG